MRNNRLPVKSAKRLASALRYVSKKMKSADSIIVHAIECVERRDEDEVMNSLADLEDTLSDALGRLLDI